MPSETPEPLKLIALDPDDLKILSAHLQDAVLRLSEMAYVPSERRFAAILDRFDWLATAAGGDGAANMRRCRCALRFDRVTRAQVQNIKPGEPAAFVELLAITYEEAEPPSGTVTLYFAGGGGVRLEVECIEAELRDLGVAWKTAIKPRHALAEAEPAPAPAKVAQDRN
ncbi:MAG: DUF2948 family protein [Rhodomicrobium sp.]